MRTKNQIYVLVILLILATAAFFFTSPYWISTEKEMRDNNYDTVLDVAAWKCKVNGAEYDPKTKRMTFDLYMLCTENNTPKAPDISLYNGRKNAQKTPLTYTLELDESWDQTDLPHYEEMDNVVVRVYHVAVENVPNDYWYVSVNFEAVTTSYHTVTQSTDVFGQAPPAEVVKEEKTWENDVQIDYRIATTKGDKNAK